MKTNRDKMGPERDNMELEDGSSSLQNLPIELTFQIANENKIMGVLANTCRQFGGQFGFFREELEERQSNQLGKYIEDADLINVEKMVKANPRLLLHPIRKIVNPDTQQIIVRMTPLQAARCEGDDEMCLMFTGCHLALMAMDGVKNIKEDRLKEAKEKRTPILIKKKNKFFIYGDPEGKGDWQLTAIKTTGFDFNKLPFEEGIIKRDDELFTSNLIDVLKNAHAQLISYIELACGSIDAGRKEVRKQLDEKFGEGKDKDKESKEVRENRLAALIQAIENEQFNEIVSCKYMLSEKTNLAITTFREEFAASQPEIIESGRRFRLELLQEIFEAYAKMVEDCRYNRKGRFLEKCALFEVAVFPFVLKYAAANDKQRFSQGLHYQREKFKRSCKTRSGDDFSKLLHEESNIFHLSGSCVDIMGGKRGFMHKRMEDLESSDIFAKFISNKNFNLEELMPQCPQKKTSRCVIC